MEHEAYMQQAIEVARGNPRAPFGTILVDIEENRRVGDGLNRSALNPILHGEIDAINQYAQQDAKRWITCVSIRPLSPAACANQLSFGRAFRKSYSAHP